MKSNFIRGIWVLATGLLLLGFLAACGDDEAKGESEGDMSVEVIAKGFQHDFWQSVQKGADQAAEELGVEINFNGPQSESAIDEQVEMLNNAVNKSPDAIALAALDTSAALGGIQQADRKSVV